LIEKLNDFLIPLVCFKYLSSGFNVEFKNNLFKNITNSNKLDMRMISMNWTSEELTQFRKRYSKIHVSIDTINWSFFDFNEVNRDYAVVFIHGTTGSAEIFWLQLKELKKHYRVMSVDVPPIDDIFVLSRSLRKLFHERGISSIILLGTSYGGYLAQAFCSLFPDVVKGLVLANTFCNTDIYNEKYGKLIRIQKLIPTFILKGIMKRSLQTIEHEITRNYLLDQLNHSLEKKTLIARLRGFINDSRLEKVQIENILILETNADPLVPSILQEDLKNTYSHAKVYTFVKEANHFPYLTRSQKYNQVLNDFLRERLNT
jgi:pimeloyl-ACP methyl ester carboxylesterase